MNDFIFHKISKLNNISYFLFYKILLFRKFHLLSFENIQIMKHIIFHLYFNKEISSKNNFRII